MQFFFLIIPLLHQQGNENISFPQPTDQLSFAFSNSVVFLEIGIVSHFFNALIYFQFFQNYKIHKNHFPLYHWKISSADGIFSYCRLQILPFHQLPGNPSWFFETAGTVDVSIGKLTLLMENLNTDYLHIDAPGDRRCLVWDSAASWLLLPWVCQTSSGYRFPQTGSGQRTWVSCPCKLLWT